MRWIFRGLAGVLVLVLLALGAVALIPAEKIAGLAVQRFEALTGRQLTLESGVRPTIWPVLGVKTGAVSIANADWSKEGPMLQAEALEISVDMAALMGGEVRITGVTAVAPQIVLERAKDGRENWVFGGANGGTVTTETPGVGTPFTLLDGVISGGSLRYVDHGTGREVALTDIAAEVAIPDYEGEARLQIAAVMGGQAVAADVTIGAFRSFLDGKVGPVEARLTAGAADISFAGRAGWNPMAGEGDLVADLAALREVSALAGIAAPSLPAGLGAERVTVAGKLTVTDAGSIHLRGGKIGLDDSTLTADADLTTDGARPNLSAKVTAGALDLRGLTGGQGGGAEGGTQAAGWPTARLDASALGALDATVALVAESADLGLAKTGPLEVTLTIDRARAVTDIRRIAAYDGVISGQFVVNARSGLSVGGNLDFAGIALQPMLQDFGGYDRLVGTGDLRVKFLGSGASVDAIMHSLEGAGSLSLGKGELRGLDIAGMLRTLDMGFVGEGQKTIFDSLGGTFTMAGGVLRNDDLKMVSPYVTAAGSGAVGLGARTLDYRIKATALADAEGAGGLTAPLMITGTWASPKFALDLEALAEQELADEKAALEAAAKAKAAEMEAQAKAKLKGELGIEQLEGESLEDAARRRAEEAMTEEARKALEQLLGGGN